MEDEGHGKGTVGTNNFDLGHLWLHFDILGLVGNLGLDQPFKRYCINTKSIDFGLSSLL